MEQKSKRGGARPNSGRPKKDDKVWGQITCILKRETIEQLRAGCGGAQKHFGPFLQDHLDRYPLPDRETYEFRKKMKELKSKPPTAATLRQIRDQEREMVVRRREERKRLREQEWAKAHPKEAKKRAAIEKALLRLRKQEAKAAKQAA